MAQATKPGSSGRGERIRARRHALRLTQYSLGELVGVRVQSISLWERDKTDISTENVKALARALGVSIDWILLGGDEEEEEDPCLLIWP